MSREGYTTISAWTRTMPMLQRLRRELSREQMLPKGKLISQAHAINYAVRQALDNALEQRQP